MAALRYCGLMNAELLCRVYTARILWRSAHRVCAPGRTRSLPPSPLPSNSSSPAPLLRRQQMGLRHCFWRLAISSNSCCHFHGKARREGEGSRSMGPGSGAPDWAGAFALLMVIINNGPYEDYKIITSILSFECPTGGH